MKYNEIIKKVISYKIQVNFKFFFLIIKYYLFYHQNSICITSKLSQSTGFLQYINIYTKKK